jgi:hypothetical protein
MNKRVLRKGIVWLFLIGAYPILVKNINAQNFGKNKVQYEHFDFEILTSNNFKVHHYLENEESAKTVAELCELWYKRHQVVFKDTFRTKNPFIVYNNHADFQQNTVIQTLIGTGTHGVTEALRTRVIVPFLESNKETSHVIGHELVHVFQFNILKQEDSLFLGNVQNIPLWMVEGMAEYLSVGRSDLQTSIWMRDAVLQNDIPTLKDMTRNPYKYFPYRYGHAFWVFVTGLWGDAIMKPLFVNTAKYGYERGIKLTLGVTPEKLSQAWERALKETYKPYIAKTNSNIAGEKVFWSENAGRLNIAPSISPNGQHLVFLSDRDVISIDIYMADPQKKEIEKRLTGAVQRPYVDEYMYLGSAGTWSPDNTKYAMSTFIKGRNQLIIVNVETKEFVKKIKINNVPSFSNPSWSPKGNKIVFSGLVQGQSDLFMYDLDTEETTQLTDDRYSELHPHWSPDGDRIVFIADRGKETDFNKNQFSSYNICVYDYKSDSVEVIDVFPGADNVNPYFSSDGKSIYFLSNADGFRNLYQYEIESRRTFKLTDYYTGIIGMTELSPAFTMARETGDIVYSVYRKGEYVLYKVNETEFLRTLVNSNEVDFRPMALPTLEKPPTNYVAQQLESYGLLDSMIFKEKPYKPEFQLEYIGSSGVGVGVSQFGTAMAGGVNMLFSDMLKRNQIYAALQVNGQIEDIGGAVNYINQSRRFNWGGGFLHFPYRYDDFRYISYDTSLIKTYRTFIDEVSLFSYYPISKNQRLEGGLGYTHYGVSLEVDTIIYTPVGRLVKRDKNPPEEDEFDPFGVLNSYIAYVGDNSHFGLTSPLKGYRYRFQVKQYFQLNKDINFDDIRFLSVSADYRKYFYTKPLGFGIRLLHYGRYNVDLADQTLVYPLYIGYNYFMRGYASGSFQNCTGDCFNINRLAGNKMALMNAEVRLPFTGPKRLAFIGSKFLYSDLVLFFDGGIAWNEGDNIRFNWKINDKWIDEEREEDNNSLYRIPVYSAGISLRINLFGMLVLEPYYAYPFQRTGLNRPIFGFGITSSGW